jgi:hypothetical protein
MSVQWRAASLIVMTYAITLSVTLATYTVNRREFYVCWVYEDLLIKMITDDDDKRKGNGFSIAAIRLVFFLFVEECV